MQSILRRLDKSRDFQIVQFTEQMILHEAIDKWPKVDCLIAFHSTGYPLAKVQEYVAKARPVILNDLNAMRHLRSRIDVFRMLQRSRIPTPSHIVVDHALCAAGYPEHVFEEHYDYIIHNGLRLNKPFIEKPADADNHNNYVYYPRNAGGGCKKLFRKVKDRSSAFYSDLHQVRRDGTYVYEEFLATFGTDVKVYTVGPLFAHAEARKAPTLDGRVQRTPHGKEVRYPVILTETEKVMAYKVVETFKQVICGFDILRTTSGQSYVCDVNGWSFVKGNIKYYNDCAHIIRMLFLTKLQEKYSFIPRELREGELCMEPEEETLRKTFIDVDDSVIHPSDSDEELRTVVVVMRHGDRKPKQKLKFETSEPEILAYHQPVGLTQPSLTRPSTEPSFGGSSNMSSGGSTLRIAFPLKKKEVKLKSPEELQELLEKTRAILQRLMNGAEENPERATTTRTTVEHFALLQRVLERGDGFTGINRKFQIKPVAWKEVETATGDKTMVVVRQLVVAKWGGELTRVGRAQAEDLGKRLRAAMYPGDDEGGLLRLHSTFRHDLKIYTSDEGRCQVTSAAFTKGFLDLEGELTPILVQMVVRNAKAHALLDSSPIHLEEREQCKQWLDTLLNSTDGVDEFDPQLRNIMTSATGYQAAADLLKHPRQTMIAIQTLIQELVEALSVQIHQFETAIAQERQFFDPRDARMSSLPCTTCSPLTHGSSAAENEKGPFAGSVVQHNVTTTLVGSPNHEPKEDVQLRSASHTLCAPPKDRSQGPCSSCRLILLLSGRLQEIRHRWEELAASWFKKKEQRFDSSKIPDLVDNVRYDLIHNHAHIGTAALQAAFSIYTHVEPLAHFIAPAEYGLTAKQKTEIGIKLIPKLLKKILSDITFFRQPPDTDTQPPFTTPPSGGKLSPTTEAGWCGPVNVTYDGIPLISLPPTESRGMVEAETRSPASVIQAPFPIEPHGIHAVAQQLPHLTGLGTSPGLPRDTQEASNAEKTVDGHAEPRNSQGDQTSTHASRFPTPHRKPPFNIPSPSEALAPSGEQDWSTNGTTATTSGTVVINTDPLWGHQEPPQTIAQREGTTNATVAATPTPTPAAASGAPPLEILRRPLPGVSTTASSGHEDVLSSCPPTQGHRCGSTGRGSPRLQTATVPTTSSSSSVDERTVLTLEEDDHTVTGLHEQQRTTDKPVEDDDDDHDDTRSHFRLKEEEAKQMGIKSPWRIVRSRYYVASASHIISLFNILFHGSSVLNEGAEPTQCSTKQHADQPPWFIQGDPSNVSSLENTPQRLSPQPTSSFPVSTERAPNIIDQDVLKTASAVTDIHYLSHIVFRVWEKRDVAFTDPSRFRLEIQFSTGAKDGFGSNYTLLREHARGKQGLFQRHVNHLLTHHSQNSARQNSDVAELPNLGTVERATNSVSYSGNLACIAGHPGCLNTQKSKKENRRLPSNDVLELISSPIVTPLHHQGSLKKIDDIEDPGVLAGLRFSESVSRIDCESLLSEAEDATFDGDDFLCQHTDTDHRSLYETDDNELRALTSCAEPKEGTAEDEQTSTQDDKRHSRRGQLLLNEPVPPYCEINPLLRLTKNCPVGAFEAVTQTLLRRVQGIYPTVSSASLAISKPPLLPSLVAEQKFEDISTPTKGYRN